MIAADVGEKLADDRTLADVGSGRRVEADLGVGRIQTAGTGKRLRDRIDKLDLLAVRTLENIGAAADFASDEAAFMHKGIGPADRADGNADIIGEIALRRQLRARRQDAMRDRIFDAVSDADVNRAGSA